MQLTNEQNLGELDGFFGSIGSALSNVVSGASKVVKTAVGGALPYLSQLPGGDVIGAVAGQVVGIKQPSGASAQPVYYQTPQPSMTGAPSQGLNPNTVLMLGGGAALAIVLAVALRGRK